jgi:hypothetical protein
MMLFFVGMACVCAHLGLRLRDRWLWVNAALFVGLAGMPHFTGVALLGWWGGNRAYGVVGGAAGSDALPCARSTDSTRPLRSL